MMTIKSTKSTKCGIVSRRRKRLASSLLSATLLLLGALGQFERLCGLLIAVDVNSCHWRELELCAVGAGSLFQNPNGLPQSEPELKRQCEYLQESSDCFQDYSERCLTKTQGDLVSLFGSDFMQLRRDFCTNGTELRQTYMKNVACLREVQKKYQRTCLTDLQVGFQSIHKLNATTRLATACCNVNRLMDCVMPRVEEDCGAEAMDMISVLLQRVIGSMVNVLCRNYEPSAETCRNLLPEPGTKYYNGRNTSALSRIISSYAAFPGPIN